MDRIKNYCQIYGVTMPQCDPSNLEYFVAIDSKEANWHWSEFDEEWFKDESAVVKYMRWSRYLDAYEENTISVDSLNEKVDAGEFYLIDDTYYNDIDTETMLPFNQAA